jgi:hypothetical protein
MLMLLPLLLLCSQPPVLLPQPGLACQAESNQQPQEALLWLHLLLHDTALAAAAVLQRYLTAAAQPAPVPATAGLLVTDPPQLVPLPPTAAQQLTPTPGPASQLHRLLIHCCSACCFRRLQQTPAAHAAAVYHQAEVPHQPATPHHHQYVYRYCH